jgi:hypothetical protein
MRSMTALVWFLCVTVPACAPPREYIIHPETLAPGREVAPALRVEDQQRVVIDPRRLDRKTATPRSDGLVAVRARSKRGHYIAGSIVLATGAVLATIGLGLLAQPCTGYGDFRCLDHDISVWAPASTGFGAMLAGMGILLGSGAVKSPELRSDQ